MVGKQKILSKSGKDITGLRGQFFVMASELVRGEDPEVRKEKWVRGDKAGPNKSTWGVWLNSKSSSK